MRRRQFIAALYGAAAMPLAARAQQADKVRRIGFLGLGTVASWMPRIAALRSGLMELGYVEGKTIAIEFRWAETIDALRDRAAELVRMNVDLIFATSSIEVEAARQKTGVIPIVFATHADPVGTGHVASLARPGGNITGLSVLQTDLTVKALEIFKEAVPPLTRLGVLFTPSAPSHRPTLQAAETAGAKLGVEIRLASVETREDFESAFSTMERDGVNGVFVAASSLFRTYREALANLAIRYRLPSMFGTRDNVEAGGLMGYAPDQYELTRRAAGYIDKILKGTDPADLPVEQSSKYQFVINLRTAQALGLEIPPILLARADEVIE